MLLFSFVCKEYTGEIKAKRTHNFKNLHTIPHTQGDERSQFHINEETHYQIYEPWSRQALSFCCYETSNERNADGETERGRGRMKGG